MKKGVKSESSGVKKDQKATGLARIPDEPPLGVHGRAALNYQLQLLEKAGKPEIMAEYERCSSNAERFAFALKINCG